MPMPPAFCRSRSALVIFGLTTAALTLGGCASRAPSGEQFAHQPHSVSAREYGYVRPATDVRVVGGTAGGQRAISSADVWDRVRYGRGLGISHNPRVDQAIASMQRNPRYLTDLSQRARPYLHLIVGELERSGLPAELALLPEVESRYNPRARSPVAATGMWQFMPYTGLEMGLRQNGWYDGRNDILASTRGAISYLRELNAEFNGDWALTLAAYNAGPGRVRSAQRANEARGKPTDFWSLNLPNETKQYVPKLLAVASLVRQPNRYGMALPRIDNRPHLEMVEARSQIDLAHAARDCGVSVQTLRDLNPGLKLGKTLPEGPHRVLVPAGAGGKLRTALAKNGKLAAPATVAQQTRQGRRNRGDNI